MEFPNSRTAATDVELSLHDFTGLTRTLRWAYDGPPPVSAGPTNALIDDVAMWLVRAGEARLSGTIGEFVVRPGQWVLPPTNSVFIQRFSPGTRLLSVRFSTRWSNDSPLLSFDRPVVFSQEDEPALHRDVQKLLRAIGPIPLSEATSLRSRPLPLGHQLRIDAAFASMLATLLPVLSKRHAAPHPPRRIDTRVESAIASLSAEPALSPRELARRLKLSISQLDRLFVSAIGITPTAWRHRHRLDVARRSLRQTSEPIKSIAFATQFRRVSHFSAWFNKATGMSPRAYRNAGDEMA